MWKEFREFIAKGNVIDLAVAVIIGGAFGAIVKSLVDDIIMPPIGLLLGNVDFTNLYFNLSGGEYESLVLNCPLFAHPLQVVDKKISGSGNAWRMEVSLA